MGMEPDSALELLGRNIVQQPWFIVAGVVVTLAFMVMTAFVIARLAQTSARGIVVVLGAVGALLAVLPSVLTALYG
jgi:predicted tellurium resistance membrane protein TerC